MRIAHAILALFFLVAAACTGSGDTGGPTALRDSAGVRIVESRRPSWGEKGPWTVDPRPLLVIGAAEGEAAYQLSQVRAAVRLADGRVVVADGGSKELRFFDTAGRFLRAAGGEGGGPGEFGSLDGVALYRGDSLATWDARHKRLSILGLDGAVGRTVTVQALSGVAAHLRGTFADGSFVLEPGPSLNDFMRRATGEARDSAAYVRYTADGTLADTLAVRADRELVAVRAGPAVLQQPVLFGRDSYFAAGAQRAFVGQSDEFRIDVLAGSGTWLMSIRRPGELRRAARTELAAARAAARADQEDRDRRVAALAGAAVPKPGHAEVPSRGTVPAFDQVIADALGNLWVRDYQADRAAASRWSVFDPRGAWMGTVEMPAGLLVAQIGPDWILARARDELDVESVRLYRLTKD
jgi:hypothetical protein